MVRGNMRHTSSCRNFHEAECLERFRALFLVDDITHEGGVRTRVTEELGCLSDDGSFVPIVVSRCLARNVFSTPKSMASISAGLGIKGISGIAYPKMPHRGWPFVCELSVIVNLVFSALVLVPLALIKRVSVIYAHNIEGGLAGILLSRYLGVRCIVDLHGVEVDEYFEKYSRWRRGGPRERFWRALEKFVATKSDAVVCVSSKHKEIIGKLRHRPDEIFVVPCFANEDVFRFQTEDRIRMREALSVDDKEVLFVHSGIFHKSADGCDPVTLFKSLQGLENKKLVALVPDPAADRNVRRLAGERLDDEIIVVRCSRDEVPKYLSAADVAMLIRRDMLVNRVASPTKFSEYLLCGLPVLISSDIGDSSGIIEENGLGIVVGGDWIDRPETLPSAGEIRSLLTAEIRKECREIGAARLSRTSWKKFYIDLVRSYLA